jgi:hypothetical protein
LKRRFGLFAAVLTTMFAAWVTLEVVVIAGQRFGIVLWVVAHLAFLIFFASVQFGLVRACLALHAGADPTFADVLAHLRAGPKFLLAELLYFLMVLAGSALLLLPGLYLAARYILVVFAMAAGEGSGLRAFQQSALLTAGVRTRLMGIVAGLLIFNTLGASVLGIGLFFTVPLSLLTMTAIYRQLAG